jgi:hypothetical protein
MRSRLALLALCALTRLARADITPVGTKEDIEQFNKMLEECAKHSKAFKQALDEWRNKKGYHIKVNVGHTGAFIDHSGDKGDPTINLDNLNKLPEPTLDEKGKPKMPADVPPWAVTRTEILMHIFEEAFQIAGGKFSASPHEEGLHRQNKVRIDFGQYNPDKVGTHPVRTQSLVGNGVDVDMVDAWETLRFNEKDELVITYIKGGACKPENEIKYDKEKKVWYKANDPNKAPVKIAMATETAPGPGLYASLGGSLPLGDLEQGAAESAAYSVALPVEVGAGYTFDNEIFVGGALSYAHAFVPGSSCPMASCSGRDLRIAAVAQKHVTITDDEPLTPWVDAGLGWEFAHTSYEASGVSTDQTVRGPFVRLGIGADYDLGDGRTIAPFLELELGRYGHASGSSGGMDFSADIPQTAFHEWITVGVRGTYQL